MIAPATGEAGARDWGRATITGKFYPKLLDPGKR